MAKALDLREKAKAKFAEAEAFAKEHGCDDAESSTASKADWDSLNAIFEDAKKLDTEYAEASAKEGIVTGIAERFDWYSKAITGRGMGMHQIHQEQPKTLGEEFVTSEEYADLVKSGVLRSDNASFKMAPVTKAAGDIITSRSEDGGSALVTPQFLPGVLGLPQRPLAVRDLFSNAPTNTDSISYAQQTAFESGAAAVAQAAVDGNPSGSKPQSSIAFERVTSPVETIATWMAATRQMLADAPQIQSLIDNQGRIMLQLVEEDQLLEGNGTSPNLRGIQSIATVQTLDLTGEDMLDGIRHSKTMVRTGLSRLQADGIVVHPDDSEAIDLLKDDNNLYRGGNPIGNFTFNQPIWSLRRVESEGVDAGTAIVGAFRAGATVYERQGITVYTTDSHSDFFIKNLIAVLFEERLGFAVFWPSAFVVITLPAGGVGSGDEGIVSD